MYTKIIDRVVGEMITGEQNEILQEFVNRMEEYGRNAYVVIGEGNIINIERA